MLAGAHPQPRLDRVLARAIDLIAHTILSAGQSLRLIGNDRAGSEAFSPLTTMVLAILTVAFVLLLEVGPLAFGRASPGKQLFALRIESASGGPVSIGQATLRAVPLIVILIVFLVSLRTSIEVWWLTLGLTTVLGLAGLIAIVRDRPTPWDRLAGTQVVSVPARW